MNAVDLFNVEIRALFDKSTDHEELQRGASRHVAALIGRNAFDESGFAPRSDVAVVLREARKNIEALAADQLAKRIVVVEIDRVLAIIGRPNLPPPSLT